MSFTKSHSLAGTTLTVTVHVEQEDVTDAEAYEALLEELNQTLKPATQAPEGAPEVKYQGKHSS